MIFLTNTLSMQLEDVLKTIVEYFMNSFISIIFLIFLIGVFILNVIKKWFIWKEMKDIAEEEKCEFLVKDGDKQDCSIPFRRKRFIKIGYSCKGCKGRTVKIADADVEKRIKKDRFVKYLIVIFADGGKSMLPYMSFLYTLAIAIFERNK